MGRISVGIDYDVDPPSERDLVPEPRSTRPADWTWDPFLDPAGADDPKPF